MRKTLKKLSDKLQAMGVQHYFSGAPIIEVVQCDKMHQLSTSTESNKKSYNDEYANSAIYLHTKHEDFAKVLKAFNAHDIYTTTLSGGTNCLAGTLTDEEAKVKYQITFFEYHEAHANDYYNECDVDLHLPMRKLAEELYQAVMSDTPWDTYHAMQLLRWGFENRFKTVTDFTAYLQEQLPYHVYLHLEVKVNAVFNIASYEGIFSDLDIED